MKSAAEDAVRRRTGEWRKALPHIAVFDNYSIWKSKSQRLFSLQYGKDHGILIELSRETEAADTDRGGVKIAAQNRKAYHDYFVEEKFEAGIELFGTEVKSIRAGTLNLKDAWCSVRDGELLVNQMHISPYEKGNIFNRDPLRVRRLLMHKGEIRKLQAQVQQQGYALVPLSVYFRNARVKVEIGLCKGKKNYDKRDTAARRDAEREMDRARKERW